MPAKYAPPQSRFFTKSLFKLGSECQTKLFYTNKDEYQNNKLEDSFLKALAGGGFQVGEYAKQLFPGGHEVAETEHEVALAKTNELLMSDEVVIFEAAVVFENLFIRVDILEKKGDEIRLYEVKSKSCKGNKESQLLGKKVSVTEKWRPYLEDIAFQYHVVNSAFPCTVKPYLMLVDENAVAPNDGLHQKFILQEGKNGRTTVKTKALSPEELDCGLLVPIFLSDSMDIIFEDLFFGPNNLRFTDWIKHLASIYQADKRCWAKATKGCKECEFKATKEQRSPSNKSGFHECWKNLKLLDDENLDEPTVLDIGNYRSKQRHLDCSKALLTDISSDCFGLTPDHSEKFTTIERQRVQVVKSQQGDDTLDLRVGLIGEMDKWTLPYNFIDFETMSPAIPMYKGNHPYDNVAFQYSHHVLDEKGRVEHKNQFIFNETGKSPNIKFVESLRAALEENKGTIFIYTLHENTILRSIRASLENDGDIAFIDRITQPTAKEIKEKTFISPGPRNMVDLNKMVKDYYYDPLMGGSTSIKKVLPAVMNTSEFLRKKYSSPIGDINVSSLNFPDNWVWNKYSGSLIEDPYNLLPTIFKNQSKLVRNALLYSNNELKNGGAAMTAYAKMQYSEMDGEERTNLAAMLLRYCELDTLAMVMIVEAWQNWLPKSHL